MTGSDTGTQEQGELLSRLFAMLTTTMEDGAALAVEGQGKAPPELRLELAGRIEGLGEDILTLSRAVQAILEKEPE